MFELSKYVYHHRWSSNEELTSVAQLDQSSKRAWTRLHVTIHEGPCHVADGMYT
jgi:hypothetical protein